eukprot:Gregarina_sp_Poly_1__102@NODE_1021_length_5328_cov_19_525375_g712_i0_p1_GENE_NODE_1021_length_5328_cov_19_525375_g712_i0NODE_1021_length_5328_cov_19_525375_g712_i0_p1_ORF_typecomplete_len511_score61_35XPCbinding/PF09280_11/1_4e04XPCbinding/PF09280_11/0_1_NODE_1021_length_5328_cov_19_525375_g712_i02531785
MRSIPAFPHSSPNTDRKRISDLLLSCAEKIIFASGATYRCPLPDELGDPTKDGKCKIFSALGINKSIIQVTETGAYLNVENKAISKPWEELMIMRSLEKEKNELGILGFFNKKADVNFIKKVLELAGPLEVLVKAYYFLKGKLDSGKTAELNVDWEQLLYNDDRNFTRFLSLLAESVKFPMDSDLAPYFRLANVSSQASSVAEFSHNLLSVFPQFIDPLKGGSELPVFTEIDMEELDNGLHDARDAEFYLRHMAMAKLSVEEKCLSRILQKINTYPFPFFKRERLTKCLEEIRNQNPQLRKLIEDFEENFENPQVKSKRDWEESEDPSVTNAQFAEAAKIRENWTFFLAFDKSDWFAAQIFNCHGFNSIMIQGLRREVRKLGILNRRSRELLRKHKATIVLLESDSNRGELLGFPYLTGSLGAVLEECLKANDFFPLFRERPWCLRDGYPLLRDPRTGCIPRMFCPGCKDKDLFSLHELHWVKKRNETLISKYDPSRMTDDEASDSGALL